MPGGLMTATSDTKLLPLGGQAPAGAEIAGVPLAEADASALAAVFAALADPVRLRLLSIVATQGEVCTCGMLEPLRRTQPTISHHTRVLAEAGLIEGDKRGKWTWWHIVPGRLEFLRDALDA